MPQGYDDAVWNAAKREAKEILAERARVRGMIPYSELTSRIQAISFGPHDPRFFHFLGEISAEESQTGRGMMTALVVYKEGDMQPGPGFFELAQVGLERLRQDRGVTQQKTIPNHRRVPCRPVREGQAQARALPDHPNRARPQWWAMA